MLKTHFGPRKRRALTTVTAIGATTALAFTMAACDSGSGGSSDDKTLTIQSVWTKGSKEGDVLEKAIAQFQTASGATVKLVDTGESTPDVYENDVLAGSQADVVLANLAEKTNDWVTNGAVVPMDQYLADWGMTDKIRPDAVSEWKDKDGKLIGLPFSGFTWPVWFNTALLKQAGVNDVPTTFDQLKDAVTKLRAAGIAPLAIGGSDWSGQKLFLQVAQSFSSEANTKDVYANAGFCANADIMKGIDYFTQLRDAGVFIDSAEGYNADSMNSLFYSGKAAMMPAGSWAFTNIPADVEPNTYLGGFPLPSGSSFDKPTAMQGYTGIGVMMSKNGEAKKDLVRQFVDVLYSKEIVSEFVSSASLIPAATTAGDATISNPLLQQAVSDLDGRVDFAVMPDTVVPGTVADTVISATAMAFTPGNDSKAICSALDTAYGK